MRALRLTLSGVLVGAVCAVAVHGQDSVRQPASLQRTSFNEYKYNSYYEQDAARRQPAAEAAAPARPNRGRPGLHHLQHGLQHLQHATAILDTIATAAWLKTC